MTTAMDVRSEVWGAVTGIDWASKRRPVYASHVRFSISVLGEAHNPKYKLCMDSAIYGALHRRLKGHFKAVTTEYQFGRLVYRLYSAQE